MWLKFWVNVYAPLILFTKTYPSVQEQFLRPLQQHPSHFIFLWLNSQQEMSKAWSQKHGSIKALSNFYKPTEINPRGITDTSPTACVSEECPKVKKIQVGNGGPVDSQTLIKQFWLKSVRWNPDRSELMRQNQVLRAPRAVLSCLFNAHRVKTHLHTPTRTHKHTHIKTELTPNPESWENKYKYLIQ